MTPPLHKSFLLPCLLGLVFGLGALFSSLSESAAGRDAARARALLAGGAPLQALDVSRRALDRFAWHPTAAYTHAIALKRTRQNEPLIVHLEQALDWHPDAASLWLLLGEAAWQANDPSLAHSALWKAFWRAPFPETSPSQLWRLAMLAGAATEGPAAPLTTAAAIQTWTLMGNDPFVQAGQREATMDDLRRVLGEGGAPEAARLLEEFKRPALP